MPEDHVTMLEQRPPRLMDQMREALRSRHYSRRTEQAYCMWVERYIRFHKIRHPADMAETEVNTFLTHLAVDQRVSASTQNQALSALLFLYRYVVGYELGNLSQEREHHDDLHSRPQPRRSRLRSPMDRL